MKFCVKQKAFLFIVFIALFFSPSVCLAKNISVELVWKFPDSGWLEVEVTQGIYHLSYNEANELLQPGESYYVGQSGLTKFIQIHNQLIILDKKTIQMVTNNGVFKVREPDKDWLSYRGDLQITEQGIPWKLVNTLDSEDYLKGVVPIEMSNAWAATGFEALKAQAVAARTYFIKNADSGGLITDSPNIHQAYAGRSVEGEASQAVEMTEGEILVDLATGKPISVYYSAHNGGYMEETQNVWVSHDPHYSSKPDPFSDGVGGIVDRWQFWIAADTLGKAFDLAPVRTIEVKTLKSGRVYEVYLSDWLGNSKAISGGAFVQKFYPYGRNISDKSFLGRLYQVEFILPDVTYVKGQPMFLLNDYEPKNKDIPGPVLAKLVSSNDGIRSEPRHFGVFVFNGRGWGHGVGMSQWGAYNMARQGYSYVDILQHYYHASTISRIPT
ncbi:MAG: sporulation protein SpoIID [Gracilibacter sp. BRH_c7a]|nr:MAG: sporulation protein SpoIID [Gracilibacter sp. BRH_c7a]